MQSHAQSLIMNLIMSVNQSNLVDVGRDYFAKLVELSELPHVPVPISTVLSGSCTGLSRFASGHHTTHQAFLVESTANEVLRLV